MTGDVRLKMTSLKKHDFGEKWQTISFKKVGFIIRKLFLL